MTRPTLDNDDARTHPAPNAAGASTPTHAAKPERRPTRTGNLHAGLVIAAVLLVLLVVFLAQNAHTVTVSFLGADLHVSLAVALLAASLAGALIVGAAGAARIAQLRVHSRRARRDDQTSRRN
jgi:uncharacterized integral membrane protein